MLSERLASNLHNKQTDLVMHMKQLKDDKRDANKSFNEQIKEGQAKIDCIAETLKTGDQTLLLKGFNSYEVENFIEGDK